MPEREDASREIEILRKDLTDDYCRTRGATIAEQLISEQESLVYWAKRKGKLINETDWKSWVGRLQEIAAGQEHLVYLCLVRVTSGCGIYAARCTPRVSLKHAIP